ncbi:pentapeptide repeat-containing protein [Actinomadura sp. 6N118]|uniref:pentapeptide repeat-containing protein n=1 Tax=Actinomadura sp. 6N118 TaxID=3375151 RepID=UPI00378C08F3
MAEGASDGEADNTSGLQEPTWTRRWERWAHLALVLGGVAVAVAVAWVLGPGAQWWLVHVDGVKVGGNGGLQGKELADALDTIRGRALTMGTGLLAAVAIYYTAGNATSARRTAQAAMEGVEAARRSAEATEAAQLRTFELTQQGQRQSEEAQRRTLALTEQGQRTDRFTAAVAQLGDSSQAVRLGGVHALAGLADDSPTAEFRQTCIDVLCSFLRMPYDSDPGDKPAEGQDPAQHTTALKHYRARREVRHTVIRIIGNHLRDGASVSWQGHDLDFTDVVFDGGDFHGAVFAASNISFRDARFVSGKVNFEGAEFEADAVDFRGARFEGGIVDFSLARFGGGTVLFSLAQIENCVIYFNSARFEGGTVEFNLVGFRGGTVHFNLARFRGGTVKFGGSVFAENGTVNFEEAVFEGSTVSLGGIGLIGGALNFGGAGFEGGTVQFDGARLTSGTVNFEGTTFGNGIVDFSSAGFGGATIEFAGSTGRRPPGLPNDLAPHLS